MFSKEMGHTWLIATNLHYLGWALFLQGAYAGAYRLSQESVALFKELGHAGFAVAAQIVLANEVSALGDEVTAQALLEEALAQGRAMESPDDIARALCGLGRLALRRGDLVRAYALYEEAAMILKQEAEIPDRVQWVLASCLEGIGEIALAQGQAAWAVRLFARAAALHTGDTHRNVKRTSLDCSRASLLPEVVSTPSNNSQTLGAMKGKRVCLRLVEPGIPGL